MKKKIKIILFFVSTIALSQTNNIKIDYTFTKDKGNYSVDTPCILWFNNNTVLFETLNSKIGEDPEKVLKDINSEECNYCKSDKPIILRGYDESVYKKYDSQNLLYFTQRIVGKKHLVKDSITFVWNLLKEKDTILGYACQTATTIFRGRKYTALYTTELPVNLGPWKFYGLPGVILKITTSNNEFSFLANSIALNEAITIDINQKIVIINNEYEQINWDYYVYIANKKFFDTKKNNESQDSNVNIQYHKPIPIKLETNIYFQSEEEFNKFYKNKSKRP